MPVDNTFVSQTHFFADQRFEKGDAVFGNRSESDRFGRQKDMKLTKRTRMLFCIFCAVVLVFSFATVAFADDDPIQVVNKLSDFIFGLIRAVGIILLGFGVLQLGLSLKSHDPSQRANGMLTIAGGIVITFTKEILTLITG